MAKLSLEYHRLSPNESVALITDDVTNIRNWRHRFVIKSKNKAGQIFKDYEHSKFKTLLEFEEFVDDLPKPEGFTI